MRSRRVGVLEVSYATHHSCVTVMCVDGCDWVVEIYVGVLESE
jgi:hypothetical protein